MITVYRIEDTETGIGFWRSKNSNGRNKIETYWFSDKISTLHLDLPTPDEDRNLQTTWLTNNSNEFYFAFQRKDDFKRWFKKSWIQHMHKKGFKIYKLQVIDTHCVKGNQQCMFKKSGIINKTDVTEEILSEF